MTYMEPQNLREEEKMDKRKLIIDCDPGVDDAYAIVMALLSEEFEVLGITGVSGNKSIDAVIPNALRLTQFLNKDVKVYRGAAANLESMRNGVVQKNDAETFHGKDGMGNSELSYTTANLAEESAEDFIISMMKKYPNQVELLTLGPLTNIALAIQKDVEAMKDCKEITIMGGAFKRHGNVSDFAEFNIYYDPEAMDLVNRELSEFVPITYVGLDATHCVLFDHNDFARLRYTGGETGRLLSKIIQGYAEQYFVHNSYLGAVIHDLFTFMTMAYPEIIVEEILSGVEIKCDEEHAGQTVLVDSDHKSRVILKLDDAKTKEIFFDFFCEK